MNKKPLMHQIFKKTAGILVLIVWIPLTGIAQDSQSVFLTLDEAIVIAQEQSPDALIARHRFLSSYWEYRSYKAQFMPKLSFEAMVPSINKSVTSYTLPNGNEVFLNRQYVGYSGDLSLSKVLGFSGCLTFSDGLGFGFSDIATDSSLSSVTSSSSFWAATGALTACCPAGREVGCTSPIPWSVYPRFTSIPSSPGSGKGVRNAKNNNNRNSRL
jgi:hypothetical protein